MTTYDRFRRAYYALPPHLAALVCEYMDERGEHEDEHGAPQTSGGAKWKRTERRLRRLERDGLARHIERVQQADGSFVAGRYVVAEALDTALGHGVSE